MSGLLQNRMTTSQPFLTLNRPRGECLVAMQQLPERRDRDPDILVSSSRMRGSSEAAGVYWIAGGRCDRWAVGSACPADAEAADDRIPRAGQPPKSWVDAFQQGLRELGYVDSKNVVVESRFTDDSVDQLPQLVDELMRLKVNVILASSGPAAQAAKSATTSLPIVFVGVIFPTEMGLVLSLGRPGGNITGLANNPVDFAGKRLELLRELVPKLRKVALGSDESDQLAAA